MSDEGKLRWYYPQSLQEVPALLRKRGVAPHGGGTSLLRGSLSKLAGLIDLSALPLNVFEHDEREIRIGATMSYGDVVRHLRKIEPGHILVKSLSQAASTPLRNRITIGGSVSLFPLWSDLMGPLLALGARVAVLGQEDSVHDIEHYIKNRKLRSGNLITEVRIPRARWISYYHRGIRTSFDYPAFSITILLAVSERAQKDMERAQKDSGGNQKDTGGDPKDSEREGWDRRTRIAIVGNTEKYCRLSDLEEVLAGSSWQKVKSMGLRRYIDVKFAGKRLGSSDYISHLAAVALQRGLDTLIGSEKVG